MKLEFQQKKLAYSVDGSVRGTEVTLGNMDGASYPVILPADQIELSNAELEVLALEVVYQENFPLRAETEKFNTMGQKIAQIDNAIERSDKQYQKMEQFMKTVSQTVNETLMSITSGKENVETTSESE